jgi:hypothetical protein
VRCTSDVVSVQLVRLRKGGIVRGGVLFCCMERNLNLH